MLKSLKDIPLNQFSHSQFWQAVLNSDTPRLCPFRHPQPHSGMEVEHQRFGKGKVVAIEGKDANRKATVQFLAAGQKQLLLRFAKLKIL